MSAEQPGLLQSLRAALKNRPFVFGLAIFLLTWVSVDLLQTIAAVLHQVRLATAKPKAT